MRNKEDGVYDGELEDFETETDEEREEIEEQNQLKKEAEDYGNTIIIPQKPEIKRKPRKPRRTKSELEIIKG